MHLDVFPIQHKKTNMYHVFALKGKTLDLNLSPEKTQGNIISC